MQKLLGFFLLYMLYFHISGQTIKPFSCPIEIDNKRFNNAFAGGLNAAQFGAFDVNLDGLKDLIVFDREGGKLTVFVKKNNGTYFYAPEFENLFPKVKNWIQFYDYNNDGVEDIFISNGAFVELYKTKINGNNISFEKYYNPKIGQYFLTYKSKSGYNENFGAYFNEQIVINDIDFDGDFDVLSFEGTNQIYFFKNLSAENDLPSDSIRLILAYECWGLFDESPYSDTIRLSPKQDSCVSRLKIKPRHAGSTLFAFDYDHDMDYDLLIGDVGSRTVTFLENGKKTEFGWMISKEKGWPSYDKPVQLKTFLGINYVDVDNDGLKDLIFSPNTTDDTPHPQNINNNHLYKSKLINGKLIFEFIEDNFLSNSMIDFGGRVFPTFVDIDKDGLFDLIVGTSPIIDQNGENPSKLLFFKNIGSKTSPYFKLFDSDFLNFSYLSKNYDVNYLKPAFGDIDSDGDEDLLVGNYRGNLIYCENKAEGANEIRFAEPVINYKSLNVNTNSYPLIADINKDGKKDILVGCGQDYHPNILQYYGSIVYFQNIGSEKEPAFDTIPINYPNTAEFGKLNFGGASTNIADAVLSYYEDNDDQLLIAGNYFGNINIYEDISQNIYSNMPAKYKEYGKISVGSNSAPTVADIDYDGYLEMLIGTPRGGFEFWDTDIKVSSHDGVNDSEKYLSIYPNPTNNILEFEMNEIDNGTLKVSIYDIMGKLVISEYISASKNKIDVQKLISGTYFAKIQFNNSNKIFKFIKTN